MNLKKSWHPQTLRNVERVWKAEQKADAESKKIEQLRKELEEERAREEMQKHAIDQGIAKKKGERVDWMYAAAGGNQVDHELYLLGKPVDKAVDPMAQENEEDTLVAGASFMNDTGANTPNDLAAKVRDDPLFLIKRKEEEKRKELLNNPVKMKQLKMMLQANLEKSSKKKKEKKKKREKGEKKRRDKNVKYHDMESDDERLENGRRGKERDNHESERSEDEVRDGRNGHKKHRRDSNRREESHVKTTGQSERKRKNRRNEELEDDVRESLKEGRRKDKERARQRNDEPNGERDHRRRWKEEEEEVEIRNGNCINHQDSKRSRLRVGDRQMQHRNGEHYSDRYRSPDRKRTQKRSRSRSPVARRDWERREKPNRRQRSSRSPPRRQRSHSHSHSPSPPKKLRKSPSPNGKKKWQNGGSSITKHMDAAEKEKRLAAMMDNAAWRDEQRGKNVKRYEEEDARLEAKEAKDTDKSAAFLHDIKIQSFSSKTTSSVSDRIRRNINSVQRTPAALDSFLGK